MRTGLLALVLVLSACSSRSGVSVCGLVGDRPDDACLPAALDLSAENCRCGSRFYWSGTSCESTAACMCFSGCERLFETLLECETVHASCIGTTDAGG
jgi:hypothetical protein